MGFLAIRDLQYRKWRVLGVIVLIAIVASLLFVMTGLVNQFQREPVLATEKAGGDLNWVVPIKTTGPLTSPSIVSPGSIESIPGAEPVLIGLASVEGLRATVVGRSPDAALSLTAGRKATAADEIVVDTSTGLKVGDTASFAGRDVAVVGTTDDATILAGLPMVFTTLEYAQATLADGASVVSAGLVADPAVTLPAGTKLMTPADVAADGLLPLEGAIGSVDLVRALLWLITLIVITAIIFVSALERTRDFAVLKAVGADRRSLALSLVLQGVLITLLAVALGAILQLFIAPSFPMTVRVPFKAYWQIPLGGVVVALLAGAVGARKAANTPAAEAFG